MRIFIAGGSGVIGRRLVTLLVTAGHTVAATTRTTNRHSHRLADLGAKVVLFDVYDASAVNDSIAAFAPDTVINQLTALPDDPTQVADAMTATNRIRTEGLGILMAAARASQVPLFLSQSVAWPLDGDAGKAIDHLEREVLAFGGTVLRYGRLWGPDTYWPSNPPGHPHIHVDRAARRTVDTLKHGPGIVTIVEDTEPPFREP